MPGIAKADLTWNSVKAFNASAAEYVPQFMQTMPKPQKESLAKLPDDQLFRVDAVSQILTWTLKGQQAQLLASQKDQLAARTERQKNECNKCSS